MKRSLFQKLSQILIVAGVLGVITLFLSQPLFAHFNNKPVLKINGEFTEKVQEADSLESTDATDVSPKTYYANEEIVFEIDTSILPSSESVLKRSHFVWDFGDGSAPQSLKYGIRTTHTYAKPGTYIVSVTVDYKPSGFTSVENEQLDSVQLTVAQGNNTQKQSITATPTKGVTEAQPVDTTSPLVILLLIIGGCLSILLTTKILQTRRHKKSAKKSRSAR